MKWISVRRAGSVTVAASLVALSIAFAGPASALPSGTWWYDYYGLSRANKITTGTGVTVAVLDTGVQANLPDLAGRVLPGKAFVGSGDARTDVPNPTAKYYGHGSAMAGFIAATGKGTGYRGIAPGAKILPVGLGEPNAQIDGTETAQAIPWAVDHGAKIINMSFGAPQACSAETQKAVDYATSRDVIVVAAVGNTPGDDNSPANCVGVIGIGVLAQSSTFSAWSGQSAGPNVDFIAPGQNLSTLLLTRNYSEPDGTGSSESAAVASGAFALLRSKYPKETARQIVTRAMYALQNKAGKENFGKRINDNIGYGSLQPQFALTTTPPAGAVNPIYDEIDKHLKATASPSTGSTTPPASSAKPDASSSDSGSSPAVVIALVVVGVVVLVLVIVLLSRSRRRRPPVGPGGYGPPPGGYGPPPGGYGPG